jgi:hypothetical protein
VRPDENRTDAPEDLSVLYAEHPGPTQFEPGPTRTDGQPQESSSDRKRGLAAAKALASTWRDWFRRNRSG